jgi:putative FmdB family regulatory protein
MPTYEYECQRCGHVFERFQRMTEEPLKRCPQCRGKVKRLIGPGAGIIFKGSGFYETDYRSEEYKQKAKSEKETSSGGDKKQDPKKTDSGKGKAKASGKAA